MYDIKVELFCHEWILSLFGTVIPLDDMSVFLDYFLKEQWPFFYKLILTFLKYHQKRLLRSNDFAEILMILKSES